AGGGSGPPESRLGKPTNATVTVRCSLTSPLWPRRTRSAMAGCRNAARHSSSGSRAAAGGGGPPGPRAPRGAAAALAECDAEVGGGERGIDGDLAAASEPAGRGRAVHGFPRDPVFDPGGPVADHAQQRGAGRATRPP